MAHICVTFNCHIAGSSQWICFMTHTGDPYVSWRQASRHVTANRRTGRWLGQYSNDPALPWWPYTWPIKASGSATAIHLIVLLTNLIVCLMWLEEPSLNQMCHRLSERKWVKKTFEIDRPYLNSSYERACVCKTVYFLKNGHMKGLNTSLQTVLQHCVL